MQRNVIILGAAGRDNMGQVIARRFIAAADIVSRYHHYA